VAWLNGTLKVLLSILVVFLVCFGSGTRQQESDDNQAAQPTGPPDTAVSLANLPSAPA
jgi:hypothetical protein